MKKHYIIEADGEMESEKLKKIIKTKKGLECLGEVTGMYLQVKQEDGQVPTYLLFNR